MSHTNILKEGIKTYMTILDSFEKLENELSNEYKNRKPLLSPEWVKYFEQRDNYLVKK